MGQVWASLVAQTVKNLPATRETSVGPLGREGSLEEKGMTIHSSLLAQRIPWTEEPGGVEGSFTVHGVTKEFDTT